MGRDTRTGCSQRFLCGQWCLRAWITRDANSTGKLCYVQELAGPLALGFIKLSFFILYLHIFNPIPKMRMTIWIGATICGIFYILIFALNMYFSTPRRGETYVTHSLNPIAKVGIYLSIPFAAIGVVFDIIIITIPIYGVYQLPLSRRQKLSISLVILPGGL